MLLFSQVVKNARLRSCEGLALPFLCNWLFGMFGFLVSSSQVYEVDM